MNRQGKLIADDAVQFVRLLPAPIDVVWEFLTSRDRVASWLAIADIEPRLGGQVKLEWEDWSTDEKPPDGSPHWTATGRVTQWDPPKSLAYTWLQPGEPESEILYELTAQGDETQLTLTHRRLRKETRHMYAGGWHTHLDLLATRLRGGERSNFIGEFKEVLQQYS
jgi:uncharacterized protein YndB with AHSA1/START domain